MARCESRAEGRTRTEQMRGKDENCSCNELQRVLRKLGKELEKGDWQVGSGGCSPIAWTTVSYSAKLKIESNSVLQQ